MSPSLDAHPSQSIPSQPQGQPGVPHSHVTLNYDTVAVYLCCSFRHRGLQWFIPHFSSPDPFSSDEQRIYNRETQYRIDLEAPLMRKALT